MTNIDFKVFMQLKAFKDRLTPQQYKTLKGQLVAGDSDGALKGLRKILLRDKEK